MVLQTILFPSRDSAPDTELFFRGVSDLPCDVERIELKKGQTLSLESYFNSFSIGKWMTYTVLDNLSLELSFEGDAQIRGYVSVGRKDDNIMEVRSEEEMYAAIHAQKKPCPITVERTSAGAVVRFGLLPEEGICFVELTAEEDCVFLGGAYGTDVKEDTLRPVELALGICTFQREKEVRRNVGLILDRLIECSESCLYHHAQVFISDNGQTLETDEFHNDRVHIFPNVNAGGAGGFTRTMIESVYRSGENFTHIILMDDDIELYPPVIERTYRLLQMMKDKWARAVVGGAMLELVKRYQQFESGASFLGINLVSYNHGWDLRRAEVIAANEVKNPINYTGWWYCCIPTENIRELGLPLPQFIHYDDIEYGVRNAKYGTILMNGLCVWHPYGLNKQAVSMNYYDIRNVMIAMAGSPSPCTKIQALVRFLGTIWTETLRYRYNSAECFFLGIEDYYKGPEYFMQIEPVSNHKRIAANNDVYEDPVGIDLSLVENRTIEERPPHCVVWGALCWLLPPLGKDRYIGLRDTGVPFFSKRLYFYDENRKKGFWMERNYKIFFRYIGRTLRDSLMILQNHDRMAERYRRMKPEYTSLAFWEKYLHID